MMGFLWVFKQWIRLGTSNALVFAVLKKLGIHLCHFLRT